MSILGMASAGLVVGAAAVAGHWVGHRQDGLGRPRGFPIWSVTLLGVLALAAAVPGVRRHQEEKRLSRVATALVGHPAVVHCQSTAGALVDAGAELGYVRFSASGVPLRSTLIKREQCGDLVRYLRGGQAHPTAAEVLAVHVLTHESMHMRGQPVESFAECEAMQRDAQTAGLLGATPAEALALARTYWDTVYPNMPDDYRNGECRAGGKLDEHLPDQPWS